MRKAVRVAMIGVGSISGIYLKNISEVFRDIELVGVCDLIRSRAEKAREEYKVGKIYDRMEEAFADPDVDIILNLTRPYEHYAVTKGALLAGKHVYSEKPLGADWAEGRELFELAAERGLRLGGAPDTFLGAGVQTCRKLIDDGWIGKPIGAAAFMICRGHETWHPDPEFYYKRGGGPMMDMGPYYVTALVNLLGEVSGVTGVTRSAFSRRTITSSEHFGETVEVEVPTYVTGTLQFSSGAVGTIFTTFDVYYPTQARLEIYGERGTIIAPDPNTFGGPIQLYRPEEGVAKEIPLLFDYSQNSRALGLADMASALTDGRDARADAQQILHVLEILTAFERSSEAQGYLPISSRYERRAPMQSGRPRGVLEAGGK
jgi:predicted dehydrogenase